MSNVHNIFSYLQLVPDGFLETDSGHLTWRRLGSLTFEDLNGLALIVSEVDPDIDCGRYSGGARWDIADPTFVRALQQEIHLREAQLRVARALRARARAGKPDALFSD